MKYYLFFLSICTYGFSITYQEQKQWSELYFANKDYAKALQYYLMLLKQDPLNPQYLYNIAYCYERLEQNKQAIFYYKELLHWYPNNDLGLLRLAITYYRMNELEKAKAILLNIIEESKGYTYTAKAFLARIYLREKKYGKAHALVKELLKENPDDHEVLLLKAQIYENEGWYCKAYEVLQPLYDQKHPKILDKLIGLRKYCKPHVDNFIISAREIEEDLVLKIKTVKLNTWLVDTSLVIPLYDKLFPYATVGYENVTQLNLQQNRNNYGLQTYSYALGAILMEATKWKIKAETKWKSGRNHNNNIFPFENQTLWQPSFVFQYYGDWLKTNWAMYKTDIIGRNPNEGNSFFVAIKTADASVETLLWPYSSSLGIRGNLSNYLSSNTNTKAVYENWIKVQFVENPFDLFFHYNYRFTTFNRVDISYYSARAKYENELTGQLIYQRGNHFLLDCKYIYSLVTQRDFTNIAEVILPQGTTSQLLRKNRYISHQFEVKPTANIGENFHAALLGRYYHDTNNYEAMLLQLDLSWFF